MAKFKEGDRVRLRPFEDNPEEFGVVETYAGNGTWIVIVDEKYKHDKYDDCIREVPTDQISRVK